MKNKLTLEEEFPILKQISDRLEQFGHPSAISTKLLEQLVSEYKVLALINRKLSKQVTLLKLLNKHKGKQNI